MAASKKNERKAKLLKVSGLALAVVTIFLFIACVSYLFHWKEDQSCLFDGSILEASKTVGNSGGKFGMKVSHFFVCNGLGLCFFAIIGLLAYISARLFSRKPSGGLLHTTAAVLSGSVLFAAILGWVGSIAGIDTAFGGGLGGRIGSVIALWSENLFGKACTALILVFLTVLWLLYVSGRFSAWLTHAFESEGKPSVAADDDDSADVPEYAEVEAETAGETAADSFAGFECAQGYSYALGEETAETEAVPETDPDTFADIPAEPVDDTPVAVSEPSADGETGSSDDSLVIIEDDTLSTEVTEELERIDNRAELSRYNFPSLDLLGDYKDKIHKVTREEVEENNATIRQTLSSYHINVDSVDAIVGPTVTLYKVKLAQGMRSNAVKALEKDIAMALGTKSVRVDMLDDAVGIEVANKTKSMVPLKQMFDDESFRETKAELPIAIGYTITQKVKTFDLAKAPHVLVAGATRQGKSVGLNVIVASLLYSKHPSELKFVFIDPKMVEFTAYKKLLHHYLALVPSAASEEDEMENAIVKDHKKANEVLQCLVVEMDQRYELLSKAGVNNIKSYNEKFRDRHLLPTDGHKFMPYMVVIIDEYADLIMSAGAGADARNLARGVSTAIVRLAQKGRAAGIHVIIATQRPTVDVITGTIKANFPTRIAFRVIARIDSQTILDQPGADKLIGNGDMLYYEGVDMERVQCAYVDMDEINAITNFIGGQMGYKQHYNTPYYLPEVPAEGSGEGGEGGGMIDMNKLDANFEEAARLVVMSQKGSTSDIQRRLGMGYARAGKVMDQLEAAGIVGPQEGAKPRPVLVSDLSELEPILNAFLNK